MIVLKQSPRGSNIPVHNFIDEIWYTTYSTLYSTSSKFKYKFEVVTLDGIIANSKNPPLSTDGVTKFNPNTVMENEIDFIFQPHILDFTKKENYLKQYRVDVSEFGISNPNSNSFKKCLVQRCFKEDYDYRDYILTNTQSKLLTEYESVRSVTLNDQGTFSCLSGRLKPGSSQTSRVWEIGLKKINSSGVYWYKSEIDTNNFFNNTNITQSDDTTLKNFDEYFLEFPSFPWNINKMNWTLIAHQLVGGPIIVDGIMVSEILTYNDTYEIYTICYPTLDGTGETSKHYYFSVEEDCNFKSIQIAWENEVGGIDYQTFRGTKSQEINMNKQNYLKNGNIWDGYNVVNKDSNHIKLGGETTFSINSQEKWSVYTDILDNQLIEDLKYLWKSRNVYARIGEFWTPIILENDDVLIFQDEIGLRQYVVEFRLSNKQKN
jgi:hypothetical protein